MAGVGAGYSHGVRLLWEQIPGLFVAEEDCVNRVSAVLERNVVAVDVGGKEDLCGRHKSAQN